MQGPGQSLPLYSYPLDAIAPSAIVAPEPTQDLLPLKQVTRW